MTLPSPQNIKVFFSYAREDENFRVKLSEQLVSLKRRGIISEWNDREITGGKDFNNEISENLDDADIILLLVSPSFIASDYCFEREMTRALERHKAGEVRVIPVILRPCDWEEMPFSQLAAFPKDGLSVTKWDNEDEAFLDIAKGVRRVAEELQNLQSQPQTTVTEKKNIKIRVEIPSPIVSFVARLDKEGHNLIEKVRQALADSENRTVVLWGYGGVGKTTLASQIARSSENEKQIVWLSADGRTEISIGVLLDEIAIQLGQPEVRQLPPTLKYEQTLLLLDEMPSLVILDNFETLKPEYQTECLNLLKNRKFESLITTRDRLEGVRNINVFEMTEPEANSYLDRLIEDSTFPSVFTEEIRQKTMRTAERNPLVMQWIVGQIGAAQSPREVFEELEHGEGDAAERVFDRSFNLPQLGNDGRSILLALSLFVQSARRKSIKGMVGFGGDVKRFNKALKSLVNLRLLNLTEGSERLYLGGLTRQFARAHLDKSQSSKIYQQRFIHYFDNFSNIHDEPTVDNLNLLEEEKINFFSALDLAFELKNWKSVFSISGNLIDFLDIRGHWEDWIIISEKVLNLAKEFDIERKISQFSHNLGLASYNRGEIDKAEQLYNESLVIDRKLNNQSGIAIGLLSLGNLASDKGEIDKAEQLYNEALEIFRKLDDQSKIASTLGNLANLANHKGEIDKAEQLYNEALEIFRKLGDQSKIGTALINLGSLANHKGEIDKAEQLYNETLEIFRKLGDQSGVAMALNAFGELYFDRKDIDKSERFCQESLEIFDKLKYIEGISENKRLLGKIFQARSNFDTSYKYYKESLAGFRQLDYKMQIALTLEKIASLAEVKGEKPRAIEFLKESFQIFEKLNSPKAKEVKADLEKMEGNLTKEN